MKKWTVRIDNVKFHVGCINFSADTVSRYPPIRISTPTLTAHFSCLGVRKKIVSVKNNGGHMPATQTVAKTELTRSEKIHLGMKEIAKRVRTRLKEEFLWCTFSVTKSTNSLRISLLSAPFEAFVSEIGDMSTNGLSLPYEQKKNLEYMKEKGHSQVNHFYIQTSPFYTDECKNVLQRVKDITDEYNYDNSDSQSDYFDVNFYLHLSIGEWDKPFQRI